MAFLQLRFTPRESKFSLGAACKFALKKIVGAGKLLLGSVRKYATKFFNWIAQPRVYPLIIAAVVTFIIITAIGLALGFGPAGVGAGTAAAAFQAAVYGGFTPAAGIFATLTSRGMLGVVAPVTITVAAAIAVVAGWIVWACGVGR